VLQAERPESGAASQALDRRQPVGEKLQLLRPRGRLRWEARSRHVRGAWAPGRRAGRLQAAERLQALDPLDVVPRQVELPELHSERRVARQQPTPPQWRFALHGL
jgi:hypothetical protein